MSDKAVISLATGLEDAEKVTVAFHETSTPFEWRRIEDAVLRIDWIREQSRRTAQADDLVVVVDAEIRE